MKKSHFTLLAVLAMLASLHTTVAFSQNKLPGASAAPPGLYVSVIDGAINLANKGGSQSFAAGQFGYTASVTQPPVTVPKNPAVQFTPPPAFSSTSSGSTNSSSKSGGVDCEVR